MGDNSNSEILVLVERIGLKLDNTRNKLLEMRNKHFFKGNMSNLEKQLNIHNNELQEYNYRISKIFTQLEKINKDLAKKNLKINELNFLIMQREMQPRDSRSSFLKFLDKTFGHGEVTAEQGCHIHFFLCLYDSTTSMYSSASQTRVICDTLNKFLLHSVFIFT